jgi:hypothetical protein
MQAIAFQTPRHSNVSIGGSGFDKGGNGSDKAKKKLGKTNSEEVIP